MVREVINGFFELLLVGDHVYVFHLQFRRLQVFKAKVIFEHFFRDKSLGLLGVSEFIQPSMGFAYIHSEVLSGSKDMLCLISLFFFKLILVLRFICGHILGEEYIAWWVPRILLYWSFAQNLWKISFSHCCQSIAWTMILALVVI